MKPFRAFDPSDPVDPATGEIPESLPTLVALAKGYTIPSDRYAEFLTFIACNPEINEAIFEIVLERTFTADVDPLTEEMCTYVPHWFQSELEWRLAQMLYQLPDPDMQERAQVFIQRSNGHLLDAQALYPVISVALNPQ